MDHLESTFNAKDGLELFYQRWRPDGEPRAAVAIVHGLGEHSGRYSNVVQTLVPRGFALYALDQRGHGRTPGQRGYVDAWADFRADVGTFLDLVRTAEPGRPLFLFGHSLGGLIVLNYGLHDPQGLHGVIASAPTLSTEGLPPIKILLSRVLSRLWPHFSIEIGLEVAALSRNPTVVEAYQNDPLVHGKGTARMGAEAHREIEWTLEHAPEWALPILIVHGGADRIVPPQTSAAFVDQLTVADRELRVFEGYYHEPHNDVGWEQPVGLVAEWIERRL